ncbi:probable mitochondrial ribosomal L43 [Lecanosticta acicola]|uniref:Large ribosomal subunit protein mL43 n=1 Tax=Lecanosticta acicola TaxID=111012 RepID=A0AAI8YRV7_9PEZI|nr:probable mitochondrial ribosomal L43 [Lecanosticta acicola]
MPLQALRTVAKPQNGVGAFILQCKRLDFYYCDWAGSSRGMNDFLKKSLPTFARENPNIEITVSPRPKKHPVVTGHYINGRQKAICVRNMTPGEILGKVQLLRGASGEKLKRVVGSGKVRSEKESVRGVWSPFHGKEMFRI